MTGGDVGSTTLELTILFPILLVVITAIVQYGLWFHARSLALAAAQQGVSAARVLGATPGAGQDRALVFVADHGSDTLLDASARTTTPGVGRVGVSVSGRSLSLLPGLPGITVTQNATGPLERFTGAGEP